MFSRPSPPDWDARVDRHIDLIDLCLTTGNYGPLHAIIAQNVADGSDPLNELLSLRSPVSAQSHPSENDLMNVGLELIHSIETYFDSQLDAFASIAHKHPRQPERLEKAAEKLVDSFHGHNKEVFARAHDQGKNIIRQLPKPEHDPASRLFTASFDSPSSVVEQQNRMLKTISDTVWNNPRRIPVTLTRAFASNRAAADVAYKWVRSIYHHNHYGQGHGHGLLSDDEEGFVSDEGGMDVIDDALTGLDPGAERLSFQRTESGWKICNVPS
ncbi:uncharacterized protein BKCO1_2500077 [Diplodia corticola]|uniref:Uncharacterized protein n=1 Tax=Diplodia corticola TaxID=236234 RepID=A0A1J9S1Y9_9PEZI|nr:uncharacterized protein BKCO1_2500077 [Diplodia corticola]OJD34036.1 hypothetical protein BKCO1_2500077 [Diplodia corticola]